MVNHNNGILNTAADGHTHAKINRDSSKTSPARARKAEREHFVRFAAAVGAIALS